MKKKLGLLVCMLTMMATLVSCGAGQFKAEDVTEYTQWSLDALYLGEFPEEYLKEFNTTAAAENEIYLQGIAVEVEYFTSMYGLVDMTESDIARMTEFYKELYSHSTFTVGTAVEVPDAENTFAIEVVIEPITLIEKIDVALEAAITAMSDDDLMNLDNAALNELVIAICEDQLAQGSITHGEAVPVMVQVVIEETKDAYVFGLSDTDIGIIDSYIIDYN